ncbi:MAG: UbiD family decarboxylase, partial [Methanomassiliicoccales archaeon]|nr:UbiD family decarboxylase [Methanomassiliicoccales archaeon]
MLMSLRAVLTSAKDVLTVKGPVPQELEPTRLLLQNQTKPVRFKINGREAVGNLYSTREAVASALGIEPQELVTKMLRANSHPRPVMEIK